MSDVDKRWPDQIDGCIRVKDPEHGQSRSLIVP